MEMTRRQVRKAAQDLINDGLDRQGVFDTLKMQPTGLNDEQLARFVRYIPSLATRAAYKVPHSILLVLLWLSAVGKSLFGLTTAAEKGWSSLYLALLLPAVTIILSIMVAMYRTRAYHTLAFLVAIGLFKFITRTDWAHFDPWNSIDIAVAVGIISLSWYLFYKVASNYQMVKQADGTIRVVFPPGPNALTGS